MGLGGELWIGDFFGGSEGFGWVLVGLFEKGGFKKKVVFFGVYCGVEVGGLSKGVGVY